MKLKPFKLSLFFCILLAVFIYSVHCLAQIPPQKLILNRAFQFSIKGGESQSFAVSLKAGQTARVEIVQNGVDVSLAAFDTKGEKFIETETPSGLLGEDLILVTAKETGEYKVEVSPASPRAKLGKYTICLKNVRPTVADDFRINDASARILELAEEATKLKYNGTIEGLQESIVKWNEAIEVSKIKKDRVWEGVAIVAQGLIYKQLGELQKTLDSYLKSLEIWRDLKNKQYEGSAVNNIGTVYGHLGEHTEALSYFERSAEINREVGDRISLGFSLSNLAYSYLRLGDYEKAEDYFRQSLVIKRENTSTRGKRTLSVTFKNLGYTLVQKGKIDEGMQYLQESLELRQNIDYHWGIADSLLTLGKIQRGFGKQKIGFDNLKEANRRSLELGDRRLQAETFYLLAEAENDRGNLENAIENIGKGLSIIEEIRSGIVGLQARYAYFSTVQNYYELYTNLLVSRFDSKKNKDDLKLAFAISERSRSRSLVELLQEAKVDFKQGIDPELLSKKQNLQKQINDKYARQQRILGGKLKRTKVTKINREINELNTQILELNIRIRKENPKFADLSEGKTISVNEIQDLLDDKTVLVEYKLGKKRSFVWLVTKDSIDIYKLPPRKVIEKKAKEFYESVVANKRNAKVETDKLSKHLREVLFGHFADELSGKRIAVVADGILQYLPFSALQDAESNYLADTNEVIILPSASVLAQIRNNSTELKQNGKTVAIFADPVFDKEDFRISKNSNNKSANQNLELNRVLRDFRFGETLPRLLASRLEARNISKLLSKNKVSVQLGFQANLENIRTANLSDYRILHFATHGLLNTAHPELSGLVFSLYDKNGKSQDGFLSLNDIYNLNLSSDMVVLSACQTALGKDVRGEGLIGLSRGFLYAGSKRIVASLWKVDDSATAEFMKRFYKNHLQKGMPASKALRQTKIEMKKIRRYQSPYYWSAFTLLGDWK